MRVRAATLADVPAVLEIKAALPLRAGSSGGFLLGSSLTEYARLVAAGRVRVLDSPAGVQGFSVTLDDAWLRAAGVLDTLAGARLDVDAGALLSGQRLALVDQLAVRPGARAHAGGLALATLELALRGHDLIGAATVLRPVPNRAMLPFLGAAGFVPVGTLAETYQGVAITSELHLLTVGAYQAARARPPLSRYLARAAGAGDVPSGPAAPAVLS
ncbi:hypothetical protein DEIPH_ctg033orf0102 [Deinococcus phoenicis]|uniref:N-acetyltransferase domain-containing protein n=1 Tax=Deinococcus phoenicis TaxID=1476583 RepID=A0A016QNF7_9DEIO|nr:hypothetical protein [Deinococcus phoenicis]EYB67680.1 hypothetical protein DEIPH_ctg033orf0102 [Deinococcus phoenicis]